MVVFDQARQDYILEIVLSIGKDPKSHFLKNVILPPLNRPDLPKLFFWCPVSQYDCRVVCLTHHCEVKCGEWLDNVTKRSNRNPRIAFDVFENIVFIQRQYTCSSGMRCGPVLSNDIDVMEQLPRDVQARFPFRKYHLTVMTHELIDLIFEQILRGLPISQIGESIVNLRSSKYARKEVAIAEQLASFCDDELYSFPSKSNIRNIVIDEYNRTEHYYKSSMALLDLGEVISIYKITKDAGELSFGAPKFWLKDRQVFIILNDRSQVLYWKLCPEITVDVTANVLNEFSKHPNASAIKTILIEKCCQEKDLYQTFFPNAEIKMTIYHAVRHVTQHIPNPQSFQTLSLVKKFGFVFRNPSDSEKEQLANTPPAEHIISNLSDFVNTEKQTLESFPEENRSKLDDAMRNLVIHIQNGCLSNIKPGFATEPCERLHRLLKRSALADANTPSNEFVTTILAITFHHYNEKKKNLHHVCSKDIIVYPARKPFIPDHTTDIKASVHRVLEETLYPVDPDRITVAEFLWKKTFYLKQTVFLFKKKFRMVDMINLMLLKELGFQFPEGDGLEDLEITLEENKKEGCIETLITAILDQLNAHGLIDVLTKFDALPGSDCDVIPRFLAHIATACKEWEITFDLEHIDLKEDAARCFLSEVIAEMISIPMALIDANQIGNINLFIPDLPLDHDTILVIAYKSSNGLFYATTSEVASTGNIKQQCRCGWKTSSMKCCTLGSGCSCVAEKRGCMECRCHVIKCQNKIQGDDTVLKPAKIRNELISCRCSRGDKCCSGKRCPCFNENQGCVSKCECFGGKCRNSYGRNVAEGKDKPAPTQDQKKQRKRRRDTILTNYPSKLKKDEESKSEATWQEYDIAALIICLQTLKKMQLELSSYNVHLLYQLLVADHFLHIGKKSLEQIEEKLTVFQTNDLVVLQTLELNSNSILQDINNCITEQQQITEPESSITMEQVISQTQSSVIKKSDTVEKETLLETAHQQYSLSLLHGVDQGFNQEDEELELCCSDLVDFSPVYRCLHIFTALGQKEVFEQYYRRERVQQARLAFDWQRATTTIKRQSGAELRVENNLSELMIRHESLHIFQAYFNQIVGFFVVEDNVMNTTEGLVTRGTVEELWEMAISRIGTVLHTQCSNLEDVSMMLLIKELIVWFSHTLSIYGFSVNPLYDVLLQMRDQYNEMLARKWRPVFDKIGSEDNYTPLCINTLKEYTPTIQEFPYCKDTPIDEFPKKFPFSCFVPETYSEVKSFIQASMRFNQNLNISRTETDNSTRKSTNLLLTKILSESVKSLLSIPTLSLAQLAQMSVNTMHLENACPELERFISEISGTTDANVSLTRLYGTSTFKDVRADAEMRIYEKLNMKIDEFLGLAAYDWSPSSISKQPSSFIMDLLAYLQGAFITFEPLPGDVAKTACMSSCKHLSMNLKMFLLDTHVRVMNMNGLQSFNIDLKQCEAFAASKPVRGFREGTLEMTFQELRQIINIFVDGDWSTYLHDHGNPNSKYNRVQPHDVMILLDKMTDNSKKINFKKADREKKKFQENLMKKLKEL